MLSKSNTMYVVVGILFGMRASVGCSHKCGSCPESSSQTTMSTACGSMWTFCLLVACRIASSFTPLSMANLICTRCAICTELSQPCAVFQAQIVLYISTVTASSTVQPSTSSTLNPSHLLTPREGEDCLQARPLPPLRRSLRQNSLRCHCVESRTGISAIAAPPRI